MLIDDEEKKEKHENLYAALQDTERAIARARKDFLIRHHLDRTTGVGECRSKRVVSKDKVHNWPNTRPIS